MVIIINDDPVYVSWIRRHRGGFVLDTRRKPTTRNTKLHRASCGEIRCSQSKRTHWTTGGRAKACSMDSSELADWAQERTGYAPRACEKCQPCRDVTTPDAECLATAASHRLTRLENDILSCVLESAVIDLDHDRNYGLTVGDIAGYLSKSTAQISHAMTQLILAGLITLEGPFKPGTWIRPSIRVLPTEISLRSIPAFGELSAGQLLREIESLRCQRVESV